ncbi:MAG TPA: hypothetical protein VHQ24_01015 [Lachnospiraceae bacterium]|nr:hypothetical protein [Lachnospiraceae bacterium]
MSIFRKVSAIVIFILSLSMFLIGCSEKNTVQKLIISTTQYANEDSLDDVSQPDTVSADQSLYASISFMESPKGMEYTGKWYIDGKMIKTETKSIETDQHGVIVFTLDSNQVTTGTLRFEVTYKDTLLSYKELTIQSDNEN